MEIEKLIEIRHLMDIQEKALVIKSEFNVEFVRAECEWAYCVVNLDLQIVDIGFYDKAMEQGASFIAETLKTVANQGIQMAVKLSRERMMSLMNSVEIELKPAEQNPKQHLNLHDQRDQRFNPEVTELHLRLSKLLPVLSNAETTLDGFAFALSSLLKVHGNILKDDSNVFHAGMLRRTTVTAGDFAFPEPQYLEDLLQTSFIELKHPLNIIDWLVYFMDEIHPFLDGNRRAGWQFSNRYLMKYGYQPIPWDALREQWEQSLEVNLIGGNRVEFILNKLIQHYEITHKRS